MKLDCCPRLGSVVGFFFALLLPAPSHAAHITIPPLIVSSLQHQVTRAIDDEVADGVWFLQVTCGRGCCYWLTACEGPGFSSNLFDAAISQGDLVTVRIQAPAGKKFVVHAPASGTAHFSASVYWSAGPNGGSVSSGPYTVTFENLVGVPPTEAHSYVTIGQQREAVEVTMDYEYTMAFEFTAFRVDLNIASPGPPVSYRYNLLGSNGGPSFGADGVTANTQTPIMEIADLATPAERTSWGRLKVLYR